MINKIRALFKRAEKPRPSITSTLPDQVRQAFSEIPQQVYVLSDGRSRQVIITSLTSFNIRKKTAHVSFNLVPSDKNFPFITKGSEYYIHALSGHAVKLLENNVADAHRLVRNGENMFLWTLKVRTVEEKTIFGKSMIIAFVIDVDLDQDTSGIAAIHQNRKFYKL
ncbi:hypothetical protein AU106_gp195 [Sinorhizobium phage phiM9]|uniref:Uncharacterized protein n=1 Tax=Sinorhizobium phage phiM9 TaxID=1636182 RepID=A0A0F6TGU7_9CAUD|nr:hypothetical protein AU106_gp195 [Sinorhizobium phage phiM9]AKE44826.1 hypothetical protein Sm_phiM9_199 [Sinorhizobium phage phiM9]